LGPDPAIIKAEVLLDGARYSPGAITGTPDADERAAVAAFQSHAGLPPTGQIDPQTWERLTSDQRPVVRVYIITRRDVAGPFAPDLGEDFAGLAALRQGPRYSGPVEALAERFHMAEALLKALNPSANFYRAGTPIIVTASGAKPLAKGEVARIDVSEAEEQVTALDHHGHVIAVFPASVGSAEHPSPTGVHRVTDVVYHPSYVFNPAKLHFGPRHGGRYGSGRVPRTRSGRHGSG
jgi:hypothetical protein